ncbi:MAG: DUF2232 domain-containing protein [Desulfobacter sp.]|nr:DUF2232 domain-containing protein [Desulfobacter sp.]WDP86706.1 MAG: DUF2232 domain-containing protein [Desulfobacter sp.]
MPLSLTHPIFIKETFIGISLCILIFAAVFAFPFLGVFALLFLPLPVLFYRLKLGRNSGGIIMAVSFFVLLLMTRELAFDVLYFGSLLITGFFLGECIERHLDIQRTMIFTVILVAGAAFTAFALYTGLQGKTMGGVLSDYLTRYFSMTAEIYSGMGIEQDQIQQLNSAFMVILPGMFMVSYMTTIWLNLLIIRTLLQRKGITLKSIEHLNHCRTPDVLVWVVIGLGLALMLPVDALKMISINSLIVLMLVYFFQGIAVVSFFFQKKKTPMALKVFCYSLIAVQLYVLIMVIGLGFFDNWINFRKIAPAKE